MRCVTKLLSPLKMFTVAAAVALTLGLAGPPRAIAADDRLNFTATTLSGAPFNGSQPAGQARGALVLDALLPVLQCRGSRPQPGGRSQSGRHLRRHRRSFRCRPDAPTGPRWATSARLGAFTLAAWVHEHGAWPWEVVLALALVVTWYLRRRA